MFDPSKCASRTLDRQANRRMQQSEAIRVRNNFALAHAAKLQHRNVNNKHTVNNYAFHIAEKMALREENREEFERQKQQNQEFVDNAEGIQCAYQYSNGKYVPKTVKQSLEASEREKSRLVQIRKERRAEKDCRKGLQCKNPKCEFKHPPATAALVLATAPAPAPAPALTAAPAPAASGVTTPATVDTSEPSTLSITDFVMHVLKIEELVKVAVEDFKDVEDMLKTSTKEWDAWLSDFDLRSRTLRMLNERMGEARATIASPTPSQ